MKGIFLFCILLSATASAEDGLLLFSSRSSKFWCANSSDPARCRQIVKPQRGRRQRWNSRYQSVRTLRREALGFTTDTEFRSLVAPKLLGANDGSERFRIRAFLWSKMNVLVLEGGVETPLGRTLNWSIAELRLIESGYLRLRQAVAAGVGTTRADEYSHIWGAGGTIARLGRKTIGGQFGELNSDFPAQVNVVANVAADGFSTDELAQRIAHENAHSQDVLLGMVRMGGDYHWSETADAAIFRFCEAPVQYETNFYECRARHPTWFNFNSTAYAAYNSAEFYALMVNEWVREKLNLVPNGRYRCQNSETAGFWHEMEKNLLGIAFGT